MRKQFRYDAGYAAWGKIAAALGRTPLGVMGRWQVLKVVDAHRRAGKARLRAALDGAQAR